MRVVVLDEVGSTNDEAVRLAEQGAALPLAVRARVQVSGRGRGGRGWASPAGGVWLSAIGAWEGVVPGSVALRAALAAWDAVAPEVGRAAERLRVKWPNDLLLDGRKIAGVLCERRGLEDGRAALVVGVGINANIEASALPTGVRLPATSLLAALGRAVDADGIEARLVQGLARVLASAEHRLGEQELARLVDRLAYLERGVVVHQLDGSVVRGTLEGLAPDGRAAVRAGERIVWVMAGDVDAGEGSLRPETGF